MPEDSFKILADHEVPSKGIPGSAAVKIPPAHAEDARDTRSIPGVGNSNPLQYSCLENSMGEEPGEPQSMGSKRVRHD